MLWSPNAQFKIIDLLTDSPAGKTERSSYSYGRESNPHCHQVSPLTNVFFSCNDQFACVASLQGFLVFLLYTYLEHNLFGFDLTSVVEDVVSLSAPDFLSFILEFNN